MKNSPANLHTGMPLQTKTNRIRDKKNKTMLKLFTKLSFHTYNTIKISYFDSLTHITGTQTCY